MVIHVASDAAVQTQSGCAVTDSVPVLLTASIEAWFSASTTAHFGGVGPVLSQPLMAAAKMMMAAHAETIERRWVTKG